MGQTLEAWELQSVSFCEFCSLKEMLSAEPYPERLSLNNSITEAHAFQEQICLTMLLFLWNVPLELCDSFYYYVRVWECSLLTKCNHLLLRL